MNTKYRSYISFTGINGTWYEFQSIEPIVFSETLENEQVFYRKKLGKDLVISINGTTAEAKELNGFVYNKLLSYYFNTEMHKRELLVKIIKNDVDQEFIGYFGITEGKMDIDSGKYLIKPNPDDKYRHILQNWEKEYNILNYGLALYPFNAIITSHEFYEHLNEGEIPVFDITEWCRVTLGGSGDYTEEIWGDYRQQRIWFPWPGYTKFTWDEYYYKASCEQQVIELNLSRNRKVSDVIQLFLNKIAEETGTVALTLNSSILNGEVNYVSGENPNPLNNLLIAQVTDYMLDSYYNFPSDPATKGMLTLKQLLDGLEKTINVKWNIEGDEYLLEHISHFENKPIGVDLTNPANTDQLYLQGTQLYDYDMGNMPNREKWTWMAAVNRDFIGYDIKYDNIATNNRDEESIRPYNLDKFTTDLSYIMSNENGINKDGFLFLVNKQYENNDQINWYMSLVNLHNLYWRHNRVLLTGNMNNEDTTFYTETKKRKHSINFKLSQTADCPVDQLITTRLIKFDNALNKLVKAKQTGMIVSKQHDLDTDIITVEIHYNLEGGGNDWLLYMIAHLLELAIKNDAELLLDYQGHSGVIPEEHIGDDTELSEEIIHATESTAAEGAINAGQV